jgi:type VI secretion system protein ImpA
VRGRAGAYSLQHLQLARSQERSPEKLAQLPPDALTLDKFNRALRETPKDDLRQTLATIQSCLDALAAWQAVIDARLGADGPSFVPAREALAAALHEVQRLAREVGALAGAPVVAEASAVAAGTEGESKRSAGGPLRTREQALGQLREVAAFFRATEPHSPVAYLADKAVHWGDMPLHLWLRSVVKDGPALAHLEELLGLEPPRDGAA